MSYRNQRIQQIQPNGKLNQNCHTKKSSVFTLELLPLVANSGLSYHYRMPLSNLCSHTTSSDYCYSDTHSEFASSSVPPPPPPPTAHSLLASAGRFLLLFHASQPKIHHFISRHKSLLIYKLLFISNEINVAYFLNFIPE